MSDFRPGQMVVCENDDFTGFLDARYYRPVKGCCYVVDKVVQSKEGHEALTLREIPGQRIALTDGWGTVCFSAARFRPARETSIAVFYQILDRCGGKHA